MQDAITLNVTPLQAVLALAFQIWIVVFPIMIMRKVDRLTRILEDHLGDPDSEDPGQDASDGNEGA